MCVCDTVCRNSYVYMCVWVYGCMYVCICMYVLYVPFTNCIVSVSRARPELKPPGTELDRIFQPATAGMLPCLYRCSCTKC